MDKVAILLAAYNGAKYLNEQINSILAQTHSEWRLFIRDDGSTDETLRIIQDAALAQEKVVFLEDDFGSTGSAAGNFFKLLDSIDLSGFDFVLFADQDDIWAPIKIEQAVRMLKKNDADCYSSNLISFNNDNGKVSFIDKAQPQKKFDYLFQGGSAGCTYCLSKKAAILICERLRGFDNFKGLSHDWLVYAICRSHKLKWVFDSGAYVFYRQHSSNVFGSKPGLSGLLQRFSLSRTGWYKGHILAIGEFLSEEGEESQVLKLVRRLGFFGRMKLAVNVWCFRRKFRDVVFLGVFIVFFM